jgi:SAM-dependent methyltransferase
MNSLRLISRSALIFFLSVTVSGLVAQDNKINSGFVPQVGQNGKDVVWVPTPTELVNKMLEIAKVTPEDFLVDLGSGDGRTVIAAAKRGARAVGIEFNPDMVELSINNAKQEGVSDKTEFRNMDLFEYDLSKATVITMFLLPEINLRLRPRLLDLKPGTRIVSNTFTMGDWEADYETETDDASSSWSTALLWIIPAKVEGSWKLPVGEVSFTQKFQMLNGTYKNGEKYTSIRDGRLNGNEITFNINGDTYHGLIKDNKITGTLTNNNKSSKSDFIATRM